MPFNKINTSRKLYLLVFIMSLFIILIGYIGIRQLKIVTHNSQSLYVDRVIPIIQLTTIRYSYVIGILSAANQVQNHEINFKEGLKQVTQAQKTIHSNWESYKTTYLTSEEKTQIKNIEIEMKQTDSIIATLSAIMKNQDSKGLNTIITSRNLDQKISAVIHKLNQLVKLQLKIGKQLYQNNNQLYKSTSARFYYLILLCLIIASSFSYYIVKNVKGLIKNLAESEGKYRNIFENVQDVFYQSDLEGVILDVSPSIKYHTGYTREQLIGTKTVDLYYNPEDREKGIQLLTETGELKEYEIQFKLDSNEMMYISLNARLIRDQDGNPTHVDGVFRNITERKYAELRMQQSENRLKEAQSLAQIGNWEMDLVSGIHIWSDELYKIFGTDKNQTQPSTEAFLSFLHPEDVDGVIKEIDDMYNNVKKSASSFRFFRKDGTLRFAYVERRFEFDQNNNPIRVYGVFQDITERKRIKFEREKMIIDIIQRNKNFEEFSHIVSHNLRGPVANILGISAVLKTVSCREERIKFEQFLFQAVEQLDEIIKILNEILNIRNEISESKENVSLAELVRDIQLDMTSLTKKDVQITTDFHIDTILTIRSYIRSIFSNIISNSIKYRQPDKTALIKLSSSIHNDKIRISFQDNGMGLDLKKYDEKIFGLSQRFHVNTQGNGIGLFLVKAQVEILGGTIKVKSEVGQGAEFIIELPIV
jgi:PAS domain S-box-containing protein